ncbi:hypothetical protein BX600DRAFT_254602 [Xylariales sp. PMI_506]|nr:hypothetical protein BX600DRAFT_254602 [Xylariales sp. PMI_506]
METVNNLAGAAAKAIWGESKNDQEPLSGVQGDTSKGEPYDKGNVEDPEAAVSSDPKETSESKSSDAEFAKTTGTAAESDKVPDNEQTDLKAKDTPADTSKGQNDTRDPEDPQTHPKNNPTDVDDTGDGPNEGQKLEGAGPKPVEEIAREHGGDAGKAKSSSSVDKAEGGVVGGEDGGGENADDDEDVDPSDPHAKSTGEGTGEKYVKSTGLAADGGDFDATRPGAGREADRLLEEKGIHRDLGSAKGAEPKESNGTHGEKKKLSERIKEKFHRN